MIVDMLESIRQIGIFMIVAQTVMHFAANGQYEKYMKIIAGVIVLLLFIRPFISGSEEQVAKWQDEITRMMEQIEAQSVDFDHMAYEGTLAEAAVIRQIEEEITRRLNEVSADHGCRVVKTTIALTGQGGELIGNGDLAGEYEFDHVRITVRDQQETGEEEAVQMEQSEIGAGQAVERKQLGVDGEQTADTAVQPGEVGTWDRQAAGEEITAKDEEDRIQIGEITVKIGSGTDTELATERQEETGENTQELRQLFAQTLGIAEDRVEVVYLGGG